MTVAPRLTLLSLALLYCDEAAVGQALGPTQLEVRALVLGQRTENTDEKDDKGLSPKAPARTLTDLLARYSGFETRRIAPALLTPDAVSWADVIFLESVEGVMERVVGEISRAVENGKGLVVTGAAVSRLTELRRYSALLGRKRASDPERGPVDPVKPAHVAVAVFDQRHPVTQSIPHFFHSAGLSGFRTNAVAQVLTSGVGTKVSKAAELAEFEPLCWSLPRGRGRVFVSRLDYRGGPSPDLAGVILARGAQWTVWGRVAIPLKGKEYKLLAESIGVEQTGIFRGRAPIDGFFRGRQIARFMTFHGADWLTRPERETEEEPEKLLDSLGIRPSDTVADLGAGNGYFSLRLARRASRGKVLAVDIQKKMLEFLEARAKRKGVKNIESVLATPTDPRLPDNAVDLVLLVDVYHELSRPAKVMASVRRSLRKDGRIVLVEYRGEDPRVPIKPLHRMLERQAIAELKALGFRWIETKRFLRRQHVLIFGRDDNRQK